MVNLSTTLLSMVVTLQSAPAGCVLLWHHQRTLLFINTVCVTLLSQGLHPPDSVLTRGMDLVTHPAITTGHCVIEAEHLSVQLTGVSFNRLGLRTNVVGTGFGWNRTEMWG